MDRDMHAPLDESRCGTRAYLRLRSEPFDEMTALLGATTELARAALVGIDRKSLYRARRGDSVATIAPQIVAALSKYAEQLAAAGYRPNLDALFAVAETAEAGAA
jgi:hypothetical protein